MYSAAVVKVDSATGGEVNGAAGVEAGVESCEEFDGMIDVD